MFNFLIAVHLKTYADARFSMAKEYVIPLVVSLRGMNLFDPKSESHYPHILGPFVSILPVMKPERIQKIEWV